MMKIRDIMTKDVRTLSPDAKMIDAAKLMRDHDTGFIPVLDGTELCGVITDRDIVVKCIAEGHDENRCPVSSHMETEVDVIGPDADVEEASRIMQEDQIRRLPVCEGNRLVGVVSLGDLAIKARGEVPAAKTLRRVSKGVKPAQAS
jgi:CBS domain-containing protein